MDVDENGAAQVLEMYSNKALIQVQKDGTCLSCEQRGLLVIEVSADDRWQAAYLCLPCTEKLARLFREYVDDRKEA